MNQTRRTVFIAVLCAVLTAATALTVWAADIGGAALGDVNRDGSIDNADVILLTRYLTTQGVALDTNAADIDRSGTIDRRDLYLLQQYTAHWPVDYGNIGAFVTTSPDDPSNPSNPSYPSAPYNPTRPSDPSNPSEPTDPTEPTNPSQPSQPVSDLTADISPMTDTATIYRSATFTVTATGGEGLLTYQWQYLDWEGKWIDGRRTQQTSAESDTYLISIPFIELTGGGNDYLKCRCIVTDGSGATVITAQAIAYAQR